MFDECSFENIQAVDCSFLKEWFCYFRVVMDHPLLEAHEKYLWIWITHHCLNQPHHTWSFKYEQISRAMNQPIRKIHCALLHLKMMGFLNADIAIDFNEPTLRIKRSYLN